VVVILSLVLLTTVAILLWKFVLNQPRGFNTPGGRAPLTVSRDGTKQFKTIRQALQSARGGDVIEIADAIHEENLVVDGKGADVILQAAPGQEVRWVHAGKDAKIPLVYISKAPRFQIKGKGITIDGLIEGQRKVQDLVFITLTSPGLIVEDLQFINIGQNAVRIMNAHGAKDEMIRLNNLSIPGTAADKSGVGVLLDASPTTSPVDNDWIEISEFRGAATPFQVKKRDNPVLGKNVILPN
jgi:hypothetical protein